MNNQLPTLSKDYAATLRQYLTNQREAALERAYELGRTASLEGLGILDMARVHQEALAELIRIPAGPKIDEEVLKSAETLLFEALSPFEAAHRGFRELNDRLQERNRELEAEVSERKRAEDALRQSEMHYQRLFNEARDMQESLRGLSNQILRTQEDERKRISRELHDEVGQSLTAISVTLTRLTNNGADYSSLTAESLAHTQKLLQETMKTVHAFARDLRPAMLDELGLLPALRTYLNGFATRTGLRVKFHGNPIAERLEADAKTVVFRIAQESLTNVNKHAQASQVAIAIRPFKDGICMEVADDGKSFKADPLAAGKSEGRLGLLGMQERVRLVNGQFTVKPRPGKGTTVRVMVPFKLSAQGGAPEQGGSPVPIKHRSPRHKLASASAETIHLIQDNSNNYGTNQSSARG